MTPAKISFPTQAAPADRQEKKEKKESQRAD